MTGGADSASSSPSGTGTNGPQSALNTEGGIKLTVSADLVLDAVFDSSSSKVYLKVDGSGPDPTPALKVDVHGVPSLAVGRELVAEAAKVGVHATLEEVRP